MGDIVYNFFALGILTHTENIFNLIFTDISYFAIIFSTVVSGTLVFVVGQIVLKFFIEPIHKQKEVIGEIADALCYYREFCVNLKKENEPIEISKERKDVGKKLKKLRSQLISKTYIIPYYKIFAIFKIVVKEQNIGKAEKELSILSNVNLTNTEGISKETGIQAIEELSRLLNIGIHTKEESKKINLLKQKTR